MHPLTRRWSIGCLAVAALSAVAIYQWQFGTPWRPRGVDKSYSFVWLDEPGPSNKGAWYACEPSGPPDSARCRVVSQQGRPVLDAAYKTWPPGTALPAAQLRVDPSATKWIEGVGLPAASLPWRPHAPFIHLVGGVVLLPAEAYARAAARCQEEHCLAPRR